MHSHVRAYTRRHPDLRTLVEARRLDVKAARVLLANGLETLLTLPSILYAVVWEKDAGTVWTGRVEFFMRKETVRQTETNRLAWQLPAHSFSSAPPTAMASVLVPVLYVVIVFGSLYIFSYLYRRHNASKYAFSCSDRVS